MKKQPNKPKALKRAKNTTRPDSRTAEKINELKAAEAIQEVVLQEAQLELPEIDNGNRFAIPEYTGKDLPNQQKRTKQAKRHYLNILRKTNGILSTACVYAKINVSTIQDWKNSDKEFESIVNFIRYEYNVDKSELVMNELRDQNENMYVRFRAAEKLLNTFGRHRGWKADYDETEEKPKVTTNFSIPDNGRRPQQKQIEQNNNNHE